MRYALLASAILLSGCATQTVWHKDGASHQDYTKDSYECEKDARQSGYYGGGIVGSMNMEEFAERCMEARGWSVAARK